MPRGKKKIVAAVPMQSIAVFTPDALPVNVRTKLEKYESKLAQARTQFGKQGLKMGQMLCKINSLLAPMKLFHPYLATVPWCPPATAYRFMRAYEVASKNLPEPVLERVIVSGLPMLGTGDKPFGRFTDAVAKVGEPPKSEEGADKWIADVRHEYSVSQKNPTRVNVKDADVPARYAELLAKAFKATHGVSPGTFMAEVRTRFMAIVTQKPPITVKPVHPRKARATAEHVAA